MSAGFGGGDDGSAPSEYAPVIWYIFDTQVDL